MEETIMETEEQCAYCGKDMAYGELVVLRRRNTFNVLLHQKCDKERQEK